MKPSVYINDAQVYITNSHRTASSTVEETSVNSKFSNLSRRVKAACASVSFKTRVKKFVFSSILNAYFNCHNYWEFKEYIRYRQSRKAEYLMNASVFQKVF